MRRALAHDFASAGTRVWMTLDTRMPAEPGPWTIERIAPGQACERLREIGRRADLTIPIAPETGGALRDLAECISDSGGRSLGSTRDAIDLTADKVRLCADLAGIGVPTPASIRVVLREGLPRDVSYPAILKPIDGAGCADTLLLGTADDPLVSSYPRDSGLLQPLVHGEPRSADIPGAARAASCPAVCRQAVHRHRRRTSRVPRGQDPDRGLAARSFGTGRHPVDTRTRGAGGRRLRRGPGLPRVSRDRNQSEAHHIVRRPDRRARTGATRAILA